MAARNRRTPAPHAQAAPPGHTGTKAVPQPPPSPETVATGALAAYQGAPVGVFATDPRLADAARAYVAAAEAPATSAAHTADWRIFSQWCAAHGVQALPATVETVIGFVTDQADVKAPATLARYTASIGQAHKLGGHPSPCADARFKKVMGGIRRTKGTKQDQKDALEPEALRRALASAVGLPAQVARDRALLLLGMATAMRRSELCAIDVEHIAAGSGGLLITIPRSKTDQEGRGRTVAVPRLASGDLCPVVALEAWLRLAGIAAGAVFRGITRGGAVRGGRLSPRYVAAAVKRAVVAAGLDPKTYGGHSLRAGYVTLARLQGADWGQIMEQTGHRKVETVRRYARRALDPFKATGVGGLLQKAMG